MPPIMKPTCPRAPRNLTVATAPLKQEEMLPKHVFKEFEN